MTVKELIKHLENYSPDDVIAYNLWSVDDVLHVSNRDYHYYHDYPEVTRAQAEEVLRRMERRKDATIGLNWDVLYYHLDEVMRESRNLNPEP